jgi:glycosyltransferase involved in cell wall biosynthesis
MLSTPKVSIIITVYNLSKYIRTTLDSALSQDYENIEIVVSDDFSTDDSVAIIKEYQEAYPGKIFPIYNEFNSGITKNSNIAFSKCTGELIAILDGDDVYLPGKISKQVSEFVNDPLLVLCYHSGEIFDSNTGKTLYTTNLTKKEDTNSTEEIIMKGGIAITSSVMMRRSAMPEKGFNELLPHVNDWWLFIEVSLKGKVKKMDGTYTRYRKHGKGISEKSLSLLEESISTLDIVFKDHPELPHLQGICEIGKARYIAGEAYRQMSKDINVTRMLIKKSIDLDDNINYKILYFLTLLPFSSSIGRVINNYKYIFKNIFNRG